jgi:hypothetical protein
VTTIGIWNVQVDIKVYLEFGNEGYLKKNSKLKRGKMHLQSTQKILHPKLQLFRVTGSVVLCSNVKPYSYRSASNMIHVYQETDFKDVR